MPSAKSFLAQELTKFFQATWFDLPAEAGKVLLGAGDEKELRKAGWKAYDAWVSLANELTNAVYSDRLFAEASGRVIEAALRFQQLGGLMAASFFGNFWPAIGLPTHSEMVALREELLSLREELAAYAARLTVAELGEEQRESTATTTSKPFQMSGYRPADRNGEAIRNGRRNIAAQ